MIQKGVMEKNENNALGEKWGEKEMGEKENILLFF